MKWAIAEKNEAEEFISYGGHWLTRDKDGALYIHRTKPTQIWDDGYWHSPYKKRVFSYHFKDVAWNTQAIYCDDIIKN